MTKQQVKQCRECQANSDRQVNDQFKPSKMPERPWQSVSADFLGPTPGGWYWFVNICDHSNWASVERIRATSEADMKKYIASQMCKSIEQKYCSMPSQNI
jgi:hypothetical protein